MTEQTSGQNILQHGLSVFRYTSKLLNKDFEGFRLPQWWGEYEDAIYANLHDFKTIKHYTIWHDIGKPFCLEIDEEGKRHFPNHAHKSKEIWDQHFPDRKDESRLIAHDMAFHTMSAEDILGLGLSNKDLCTLLITSLAELHSNADMFGELGEESISFKIKFKKWSKTAHRICEKLFNHSYMYILVRKDLSARQQAVQSCHAAIESARNFINPGDEHPSTIICHVKGEDKLLMCANELKEKGIDFQLFREPDLHNQATALASKPLRGKDRQVFSRFQLMNL